MANFRNAPSHLCYGSSLDGSGQKERASEDVKLVRILPTKTLFRSEFYYRKYLMDDSSTRYDSRVSHYISKMARKIAVHMKSQYFDGKDQINILGFLPSLKTACDANGIYEGAAKSLFKFFVDKTTRAALSMSLTTNKDHRN